MEPRRPRPPVSLDAMRLAAIRRGEVAAFESLYLDRYTALVQFASRYGHDVTIAEEIVHDVFLAIWVGRSGWNPATTIDAYLYGSVRNRALSASHRASRMAGDTKGMGTVSATLLPDVALLGEEQAKVIHDAVQSLSERAREVVTLRWEQGLSYPEIGHILGVSEDAVRKLATRALGKLRELLASYGE